MKDLQKFEQFEPKLYNSFLKENTPINFEPFPIKSRLCSKFESIKIKLGNSKRPHLSTKPSFSMPFIKPPNMIPNIDEEAIQNEFTLKQIDAPMPEAPWIRRCEYGIKFTDNILQDDEEVDDEIGQSMEIHLKIKQDASPKAPIKGKQQKKSQQQQYQDESPYVQSIEVNKQPRNQNQKGISERILQNTALYLVDNDDDELFSDKHKISLFDDSRFEDQTIDHAKHSKTNSLRQGNILGQDSVGDELIHQ